jgi:hypothetical protein
MNQIVTLILRANYQFHHPVHLPASSTLRTYGCNLYGGHLLLISSGDGGDCQTNDKVCGDRKQHTNTTYRRATKMQERYKLIDAWKAVGPGLRHK